MHQASTKHYVTKANKLKEKQKLNAKTNIKEQKK